jgi:hypothetical protein
MSFEICPDPTPGIDWGCTYASSGIWMSRLMVKPLVRDMIRQTLDQLDRQMQSPSSASYNYTHMLVRILDVAHPTHQLQASVLAYPLYGTTIVRRRLQTLGYDLATDSEEGGSFSGNTVLHIMKQLDARFQKYHSFYFEFSTPDAVAWRVGMVFGPLAVCIAFEVIGT